MNWDHRQEHMIEIESAAVITTDWLRWIRRAQVANVYRWLRVRCVRRRRRRAISGQRRPLLRCWGLAPCSMSLTLSARSCIGRASLRPSRPALRLFQSVSSLAKEIPTRLRKVACACKIESCTCSLSRSYATKVRTRMLTKLRVSYPF